MSTDTNDTNPAATSEASMAGPETAAAPIDPRSDLQPAEEASAVVDDDADAEPGIGNRKVVSPSVAETAWDDDDIEPGDDIGNRIDGPAHHERTITETEVAAAGKSKRKRRKKKGGEAAQDAQVAGEPRGSSKPARGAAPQRERPAFRIGEEVFGKVVDVSDDAVVIDLSGKALAIFDRAELAAENVPQVGDHFVANVHGDGSRGGMVVLTHNAARADAARQAVEAAATSGDTVLGLVTGVIKGGVEVDVSGLRAFAPASHVELRLGADLGHLVGKRFPFKVVKYAKNGREVILSRREILEQEAAEARRQALALLEPNAVVDAVVRSVVEWGVFVAIPSAGNIEGLVHITEASHDRSTRLADQFKPGQAIQVKVLRIDDKGKLWLSHKAVSGDPWEKAAETFAVGSRHKGRVARIQPFGAFIELAPGIDGLIRTGDLSLRRINDPSEVIKPGDEIEVVVVHLDVAQRKIALHPAPPEGEVEAPQKVAPHRTLRVAVVSAEPGGLVVRVLGVTGGAARGFIPAGHTGTARGTDLRKEFPAGTILEAKVIEVDSRRGDCKLSIRALKEDSEKAAFNEYRAKVARESKFGTFGDLFAKRNGG
jgi:small subunit ribosomal protein S1